MTIAAKIRSDLLLPQDCGARPPPTPRCVCSGSAEGLPVRCGLRARPLSLFGSRGTAAGARALTLSGGRDPLEEGRGGSAGAGQPKFPGFPTERLCGDPVYHPPVTAPGPAPHLPVRALAGDFCKARTSFLGSCALSNPVIPPRGVWDLPQ